MSSTLRSRKRGNVVIWTLMAMLILGLGGFGVSNFGGSLRTIGSVGNRDIDVNDYARALSRELQAASAQVGQPLSFAQAQVLGLDRQVRAQLLATAALEGEAARIGVSVGDDEVRRQLTQIPAFAGPSGSFERDTYALSLRQEGFSEAEFEGRLRDDIARSLLQRAALGGTAAPADHVARLASWATEIRDLSVAELIVSDLAAPVPAPDAAELAAYYDAHPDDFTRPEARQITYAWLSPDMLAEAATLDDEALRATYQERIAEFVVPERRLVERLVYPDADAAEAARARFDAGEATFEDLATERGLSLADIDLGEVYQRDLGAAGDAVFALDAPGVVGPLPSALGPALYAMNAILDASETTFEEARDDLAAEATMDRARRLIAERVDAIEDLLASGATLEEIAGDEGMELGKIAFAGDNPDGIAAYAAFREAAATVTPDDFPSLVALEDGGVFALRLDGIEPAALRPFEEVRDTVAARWTRDATQKALVARAEEIKAALDSGAALGATGLVVTRYPGFARGGFIADTPAEVVTKAFALPAGGSAVIDSASRVHIVTVDAVHRADAASDEVTRATQAIAAQADPALAQDIFQLYTQALQNRSRIRLDGRAIDAVHAQLN